jgi:hypothetical protein
LSRTALRVSNKGWRCRKKQPFGADSCPKGARHGRSRPQSGVQNSTHRKGDWVLTNST